MTPLLVRFQNIMPISAAMFRSDCKNPVPQCPPRLNVEMLTPVIWSRMPNHFLKPEVGRVSERLGWMVECTEPLTMMALHIPEENRSVPVSGPPIQGPLWSGIEMWKISHYN